MSVGGFILLWWQVVTVQVTVEIVENSVRIELKGFKKLRNFFFKEKRLMYVSLDFFKVEKLCFFFEAK